MEGKQKQMQPFLLATNHLSAKMSQLSRKIVSRESSAVIHLVKNQATIKQAAECESLMKRPKLKLN
jgi:hypothetical protein